MSADSRSRKVYFSKARAAMYLGGSAFVIFLAVIAVVQGGGSTVDHAIGLGLGCVALVGLLRWAACAVIADDEVTVRNPLRTYRIRYDQIERIYEDGASYGTYSLVVAFKLKDGRVVRASALTTYVPTPRRRGDRYAERVINDLLGRTQAAAPGILDQPAHLA